MDIIKDVFKKSIIDTNKLIPFGFIRQENGYFYRQIFHNGQFEARIFIDNNNNISGKVIDLDFNEKYYQIESDNVISNYVNQIKAEYKEILKDIDDHCCNKKLFMSNQANRLVNHIKEKYNEDIDFPFKDNEAGVLRYHINKKWYGIIMNVLKSKITRGLNDNYLIDVINIKVDNIDDLLKNDNIYKAYHMANKKWVSIILDDSINDKLLYDLIDKSRYLIKEKRK